MKLAPVLLVLVCLGLAGCEETSTTNGGDQSGGGNKDARLRAVFEDKSKDAYQRADAYAAFVSGGNIRPCPLAVGQVGKTGTYEETFKCVNNAAFAGCFEALTGVAFNEQEYRSEYPEPLMFSSAKAAYEKCKSFK